jgi:hypothetical protein
VFYRSWTASSSPIVPNVMISLSPPTRLRAIPAHWMMMVGKAKVMNYEDFVGAQAKRDAKEPTVVN